jgi:hypothetical protein
VFGQGDEEHRVSALLSPSLQGSWRQSHVLSSQNDWQAQWNIMQEPSSSISAWMSSSDVRRYEDGVRSLTIVADLYMHHKVAVCVSRREEQTEKCLDTVLEHYRGSHRGVFRALSQDRWRNNIQSTIVQYLRSSLHAWSEVRKEYKWRISLARHRLPLVVIISPHSRRQILSGHPAVTL